ncbi:hypothetical protein [Enhygromyxa salina]|uniref:hypothetical protein n=1 Tax=Enhygromyxa salina TaxID=215803 RepID=UPI0011B1E3D2|nr:hypothetical protein [Enhygromyxa salina]
MSSSRQRAVWVASLALALVTSCKTQPTTPTTGAPSALAAGTEKLMIEPAPEHLRGRVALPAGARLYARPSYQSPSWVLKLPEPPLTAAEAPPRARAFRVIGVVRSNDPAIGATTGFVAVTNDLDGEDEDPPRGCGPRFSDLAHLRVLLYVPEVHLAEVTTRALELAPFSAAGEDERMQVGAGVRVGAKSPTQGLPAPPADASWRWIDADGIRVLAPIPDDAVGVAWAPADAPELPDAGEPLLRDAEGSVLWLRDDGGAELELIVRNECGEHRRVIDDPAEIESLRALALDVFYDQSPPPEPVPVVQPEADYLIVANTPLRWPDGDLAGEVLDDWAASVGVGQSWGDRRCFPLVLSSELAPLDDPALACVKPEALEPLPGARGFGVSSELELGGTIVLGPAEVLVGEWDEQRLRPVLNSHHDTLSECLRPLLMADEVVAARWVLAMTVASDGRVDQVDVTALGSSRETVEECLRAEAFSWLMPKGGGQVLIPVTLGPWDASGGGDPGDPGAAEPEPPEPPEVEPERRRGEVIIIRDEAPDAGE